MTSYTAIANGDIDQDSPVTQPLVTALRDNPIAIGEADSSVPANLLPTVHLGTFTTTSGSTVTLTSLDLTPYKFIRAVWNGVSHSGLIDPRSFSFNSITVTQAASGNQTAFGFIDVDLNNEIGVSILLYNEVTTTTIADFNINNSTTSISVSVSGNSFDAGSIRLYGMK